MYFVPRAILVTHTGLEISGSHTEIGHLLTRMGYLIEVHEANVSLQESITKVSRVATIMVQVPRFASPAKVAQRQALLSHPILPTNRFLGPRYLTSCTPSSTKLRSRLIHSPLPMSSTYFLRIAGRTQTSSLFRSHAPPQRLPVLSGGLSVRVACGSFSTSARRAVDKDGQESAHDHEESFEEFTARYASLPFAISYH